MNSKSGNFCFQQKIFCLFVCLFVCLYPVCIFLPILSGKCNCLQDVFRTFVVFTVIIMCCRFLEVDGECVINLTDCQLYKLMNSKATGMKVVVLRAADQPTSNVSDDALESLREDLSLALMELESVQSENVQLTAELARYVVFNSMHTLAVPSCT